MPGPSVLTPADSERQELETVQTALAKTPRLVKLLCYLANNYFEGTTDRLTEFNIATEVFGRNRETFIASEDAIARVETHRLRKKLKLFYETQGRQHPVQISIPLGTYVPAFTHQKEHQVHPADSTGPIGTLDEAAEADIEAELPVPEATNVPPDTPPIYPPAAFRSWRIHFTWKHALAAGLILCVLGIVTVIRLTNAKTSDASGPSLTAGIPASGAARSASSTGSLQLSGVTIPFRMIAGYSGPAQKDAEGYLWQADQYYHRGWGLHRSAVFIPRANDPLIFQYGRAGEMDYDIPLQPGTYELHLYFMQAAETALGEDSENKAVFDVALNGKPILKSFDIVSDAMGRNTADERVFRDISPAPDGQLHLHLSTVVGTPSISAIALFQGSPGKLQPIRIVTQPMPRTDDNGLLWRPDNYFIGGRHLSHNLPATDPASLDMLSTERYGHFTYAVPVDPRDQYTVSLYFVELFFGTLESNGGGIGSRVFRVICNGNTILDNFDIFKEAGNFHVVKKTFYHVRPTEQGKLNLTFEPITNYATVSAIEVLDEAR